LWDWGSLVEPNTSIMICSQFQDLSNERRQRSAVLLKNHFLPDVENDNTTEGDQSTTPSDLEPVRTLKRKRAVRVENQNQSVDPQPISFNIMSFTRLAAIKADKNYSISNSNLIASNIATTFQSPLYRFLNVSIRRQIWFL
jgi:hypothetical protein